MLSAITGLLGVWGSLAAGAAIFAAAGVFLWRVRAGGAMAERAKRERELAKARSIADRIDAKISGQDTTTSREELRQWSRK